MQNGGAIGSDPVFSLRIGLRWCRDLMLLRTKQLLVIFMKLEMGRDAGLEGEAGKGWQESRGDRRFGS